MEARQLLQSLRGELRRDGEIILAHLLKRKPGELYLLSEEVPEEVVKEFKRLMELRERGFPTAYLIGEWDFYGRTFKVKEGVLVPRPETELLVEKTLELIPTDKEMEGFEVGGGTGCISITLLLERGLLRMAVDDVNPTAVELMKENAKIHGVDYRLEVFEGDMFSPIKGRRFDFIVSNPPYIPENFWERLPPEVRREGREALIGGEKGYEFYERFAKEVPRHLKGGGFVALEIGHDQGRVVEELLKGAGFERVIIYKDYSGQDRVVIAWS